jgi:hypothetical protein
LKKRLFQTQKERRESRLSAFFFFNAQQKSPLRAHRLSPINRQTAQRAYSYLTQRAADAKEKPLGAGNTAGPERHPAQAKLAGIEPLANIAVIDAGSSARQNSSGIRCHGGTGPGAGPVGQFYESTLRLPAAFPELF